MRLICPNCDAQYDVADDVIPAGGRDVQCSSCGETWFQNDANHKPEPTPPPAPTTTPLQRSSTGRAPLASSVADILRHEAERELNARDKEETGSGLEHQTDMAIERATPAPVSEAQKARTRDHVSRIAHDEPPAAAKVTVSATSAVATSKTLPNMDEINATLRARKEREQAIVVEEEIQRRGFRLGFGTVLFIIGGLVALYVFAPQISEMAPQLADIMTSYVAVVDQARVWLNAQVAWIMEQTNQLIASFAGETPDPT